MLPIDSANRRSYRPPPREGVTVMAVRMVRAMSLSRVISSARLVPRFAAALRTLSAVADISFSSGRPRKLHRLVDLFLC